MLEAAGELQCPKINAVTVGPLGSAMAVGDSMSSPGLRDQRHVHQCCQPVN